MWKEGLKIRENCGKKQWVIPDWYTSSTKNGPYESHESICVLNLSVQQNGCITAGNDADDYNAVLSMRCEKCQNNR